MKNFIIIIFVFKASFLLSSCEKKSSTDNHAEETEEHHDEHENESTATLTQEQLKSIKLEYGSIEKKQLTATLKVNGFLRVPNNNKANVSAISGGAIKTIQVQIGNMVKKGQVIATITNTSFIPLQEDYLSVSSKEALAQLEFQRQTELQQGNAGALKNLQSIEAEIKLLKTRKASLQKQLDLFGINTSSLSNDNIQSVVNIVSPISGTISNVLVNIGSYVEANNPIVEIVDNSQLHLDLYVYEKDLSKIQVGQTINFSLTNNPVKAYNATVYALSNTFEQNTKAIAVHALVKGDKQGLIDGMSISAIVSLENATVDAVPTNAIVNHEGKDYIFILSDAHSEEEHHEEKEVVGEAEHKHDEHGHDHGGHEEGEHAEEEHEEAGITFEKIPVTKGTTDMGFSEITLIKEIPADSKVVVNGAFFILAKMNNKGEGHAH
jgi:cobalt-zinc-cadmium efflux system membrane fusion protein